MEDKQVTAKELAARVAPILSEGPWTLVPRAEDHGWYAEIKRADGAEISFNIDRHKGRVSINGSFRRDERNGGTYEPRVYPQGSGERLRCESIGVGITRTPQAMATEIERRLLPTYLPMFAESLKVEAAQKAANLDAEHTAVKLGGILGTNVRGLDKDRGKDRALESRALTLYDDGISVEVNRYGTVKVEISSSTKDMEFLIQLCKLLRARQDVRKRENAEE